MLPLLNRRVLITRARGQASALAAALEALGATTVLIPTIEIVPPQSPCALDAALSSIRSFDWLLFTSANAVQAYLARACQLGLGPHARRIAAIGPATARAAAEAGFAVDLVPPRAIAESFADALQPHASGAHMLLVRAEEARDVLPERLRAAGATVTIAAAYRNIIPAESAAALRSLFTTAPPDAITFTSASTAHHLAALLEAAALALPDGITLASIGPVTSQAMRELNLQPQVEASAATIESLAAALSRYLEAHQP